MNEQEGEPMVFRPHGSSPIEITSPEELAKSGIQIYHGFIEEKWGSGAIERYKSALIAKTINVANCAIAFEAELDQVVTSKIVNFSYDK